MRCSWRHQRRKVRRINCHIQRSPLPPGSSPGLTYRLLIHKARRAAHPLLCRVSAGGKPEAGRARPRPVTRQADSRLIRFGMHLNDIDGEMTNLCRFARSVPISIEMEAPLPSLDQLRANAAECIRLAEAARTSEHKSFFIEMAERWLTLAERAAKTQ